MNEEKDFAFNIKEHIGVINTYASGWSKELNLVEWNGNNAKFDIRDWEPSHEHMSRGITLHKDEAKILAGLISDFFANNKDEEINELRAVSEANRRYCRKRKPRQHAGSFLVRWGTLKFPII
mgnify:CR=1 FL=1